MLTRYKPSGKTSARLIPAALVGAAIAVGLAWPYQALINWVPFIYINLVIWIGMAIVVGAITVFVCSVGHNRNRLVGILVGAVIASAAVAGSHYWSYRSARAEIREELAKDMSPAEVDELIANEVTLRRYLDVRAEAGWSLGTRSSDGKGDLVGPVVWIIWGIEALGLLFAAVYMGGKGSPFCEKCNTSIDEQPLFTRTDLDLGDLGAITEAQHVEALVEIPPRSEPSSGGLRVKYAAHVCPTCDGDVYLTVTSVMPSVKEDDSDEEKTVHEEVVLQREHYNRLLALREELHQSGNVAI